MTRSVPKATFEYEYEYHFIEYEYEYHFIEYEYDQEQPFLAVRVFRGHAALVFCFLVLSIAVLVLLLVLDCVIRLASKTSFKGVQAVEDGNESSTPAADC